jgi:lysyl-tRNA synthetase class I
MAGLTRIMGRAYNRLISKGLPRDALSLVDDWEELRARPRVLEEIPKWAEEMGQVEPVVEIPNVEGKLLGEEEASEDFARHVGLRSLIGSLFRVGLVCRFFGNVAQVD